MLYGLGLFVVEGVKARQREKIKKGGVSEVIDFIVEDSMGFDSLSLPSPFLCTHLLSWTVSVGMIPRSPCGKKLGHEKKKAGRERLGRWEAHWRSQWLRYLIGLVCPDS